MNGDSIAFQSEYIFWKPTLKRAGIRERGQYRIRGMASLPAPASAAPSLLSPAVAQACTGNLTTSLRVAAPSEPCYLTSAEMAGPIPRAAGGSGSRPGAFLLYKLSDLPRRTATSTLGILSAALQGASAI